MLEQWDEIDVKSVSGRDNLGLEDKWEVECGPSTHQPNVSDLLRDLRRARDNVESSDIYVKWNETSHQ